MKCRLVSPSRMIPSTRKVALHWPRVCSGDLKTGTGTHSAGLDSDRSLWPEEWGIRIRLCMDFEAIFFGSKIASCNAI